jgi:hypothetical protein
LAEKQSGEGDRRRRVVGIYIGWDGAVGPAFLRNLSFWDRKRAADRISQSSVLTKIFAATKYARKQEAGEITVRDLTIMIGHSFGARILYTATSQVLIDEVQRRHPGKVKSSYEVIAGPADLILLLNPALEASVFTAMHSVRRRDSNWWESIDARQQALLLAISSVNDWATGLAFPLGQLLRSPERIGSAIRSETTSITSRTASRRRSRVMAQLRLVAFGTTISRRTGSNCGGQQRVTQAIRSWSPGPHQTSSMGTTESGEKI